MKVRSLQELEPSNRSGSGSLGLELLFIFKTLLIASANAVALASHELENVVSSSSRLWCVYMMAGVDGWVDGQVTGLEFPELSRKVKLSSTVPALMDLWVKH